MKRENLIRKRQTSTLREPPGSELKSELGVIVERLYHLLDNHLLGTYEYMYMHTLQQILILFFALLCSGKEVMQIAKQRFQFRSDD